MLKQSLVQEKISDLTNIGATTTNNTTSSTNNNNTNSNQNPNIISLISSDGSPTTNLRNARQLASSTNNIRLNELATNSNESDLISQQQRQQKKHQPSFWSSSMNNLNVNNNSNSNKNSTDSGHNYFNLNTNNLKNLNNINENLNHNNNRHNFHANNDSNSLNKNITNQSHNDNNNSNFNSENENNFESSMKLNYLEKSIRFIQQQHVDILNGLHQEIEKLKNENRGNFYKLNVARKL
jgi:hypothetical protein